MKSLVSLTPLAHVTALCMLAFAAQAQSGAPGDEKAYAQQLQQRSQARAAERAEMAQLQQQITQRRTQAEQACWQRFAVEDCLRNVLAQERTEMNQLRERELRINNEERQDKADERLREIARKQQQGTTPARVQMLPRNAPAGTAQQPATPVGTAPASAAPTAPEKTPADIAREQSQRQIDAQQRAAEQAQRLQAHEGAVAAHALTEAERRNRVKKNMQQKQEQAQSRRERKADDIAARKGAPLPIPQGLPQPKP